MRLNVPPPVPVPAGGRGAEALVQLVYPQYARGHRLGLAQGRAHIPLGVADVAAHEHAI